MRLPESAPGSDRLLEGVEQARALGADYADLRYVARRQESAVARDGRLESATTVTDSGVGIRVLRNGSWGFAATPSTTPDAIHAAARRAVAVADASARLVRDPVRLDDTPPARGDWTGACEEDPFSVPWEERIGLVVGVTEELGRPPEVRAAEAGLRAMRTWKIFASTEGALVRQEKTETAAGMKAVAEVDGEVQHRSYPASFGGDMAARGYEFVRGLDLPGHVEQTRDEAVALCRAKIVPAGVADIILEGSQLALQIHESCGHPTELDRALGTEISFAGGSFLTPDKLGNLRYGSDKVSIIADATVDGSIGSFGFDDEGVPARRVPLIENGLFVGYLSSRETAPRVGRRSSGAMRADGWNRIPLVRMVTVSLEPGEGTLDELVSDTRRGWLFCTNKSWSIDDLRLNFQFGCELAREIRDGRLGAIYRNPVYTGITPRFWGGCDAVCGPAEWRVWGVPNCGKGEPMQTMHVAHGAAPTRFRKVEIGGGS